MSDEAKDATSGGLLLPPWESVRASSPPPRSPELIFKLLRRGHVMLIAGKAKTGKSFAAIQLAVAVATGGEWLGYKCEPGQVLFINPEIDSASLDKRFSRVCEAMGANPRDVDHHVSKWTLRGVEGASMSAIVHDLEVKAMKGQFDLVIIDSASVFVEGDENSASDVRKFTSNVLRIAEITGAAVMLVHHYGKGAAGDRSAGDRARGSSVWLDSPDAALYMTVVQPPSGEASDYLDDGVVPLLLECGGQREFPAPGPLRLLFTYPIHRVDVDGITEGWKPASSQQNGGKKSAEASKAKAEASAAKAINKLLAHCYAESIGADGMTIAEAASVAGVDVKTLTSYLSGSEYFEIVQISERRRKVKPKRPPEPEQGSLED